MYFSPYLTILSLFGRNVLLSILKRPQSVFFLYAIDKVSHQYKTTGKTNESVEIVEFIKFSEMVNHACEYINVYCTNFV
jgi:hypothetical protein